MKRKYYILSKIFTKIFTKIIRCHISHVWLDENSGIWPFFPSLFLCIFLRPHLFPYIHLLPILNSLKQPWDNQLWLKGYAHSLTHRHISVKKCNCFYTTVTEIIFNAHLCSFLHVLSLKCCIYVNRLVLHMTY